MRRSPLSPEPPAGKGMAEFQCAKKDGARGGRIELFQAIEVIQFSSKPKSDTRKNTRSFWVAMKSYAHPAQPLIRLRESAQPPLESSAGGTIWAAVGII